MEDMATIKRTGSKPPAKKQKAAANPKAKKAPKPKKDQRVQWVTLPEELYDDTLNGVMHFSSKLVNSNASPLNVRLCAADKADLPFVGVTTLGPDRVPFDFSGNAGTAKQAAQLLAALEGRVHEKYKDAPAEEVEALVARRGELEKPSLFGVPDVSIRLRQVLFPVSGNAAGSAEETDYVALTPLHSSGLSVLLSDLLKKEREDAEAAGTKAPYRKRAFLGYGGANPQNIGLRVRAMQEALVFDVPRENNDIKAAYSVRHKGISLTPPKQLMESYLAWREKKLKAAERKAEGSDMPAGMPSTRITRETERDFLTQMVGAVVARRAKAQQSLDRVADFQGEVSRELPAVQQALFSDEAHYPEFVHDCAAGMLRGLEAYSEATARPLASSAINRLMPDVEAAFRKALL